MQKREKSKKSSNIVFRSKFLSSSPERKKNAEEFLKKHQNFVFPSYKHNPICNSSFTVVSENFAEQRSDGEEPENEILIKGTEKDEEKLRNSHQFTNDLSSTYSGANENTETYEKESRKRRRKRKNERRNPKTIYLSPKFKNKEDESFPDESKSTEGEENEQKLLDMKPKFEEESVNEQFFEEEEMLNIVQNQSDALTHSKGIQVNVEEEDESEDEEEEVLSPIKEKYCSKETQTPTKSKFVLKENKANDETMTKTPNKQYQTEVILDESPVISPSFSTKNKAKKEAHNIPYNPRTLSIGGRAEMNESEGSFTGEVEAKGDKSIWMFVPLDNVGSKSMKVTAQKKIKTLLPNSSKILLAVKSLIKEDDRESKSFEIGRMMTCYQRGHFIILVSYGNNVRGVYVYLNEHLENIWGDGPDTIEIDDVKAYYKRKYAGKTLIELSGDKGLFDNDAIAFTI